MVRCVEDHRSHAKFVHSSDSGGCTTQREISCEAASKIIPPIGSSLEWYEEERKARVESGEVVLPPKRSTREEANEYGMEAPI